MSAPKRINLMPRNVKAPNAMTRDQLLMWIAIPMVSLILLDFVSTSRQYANHALQLSQTRASISTIEQQMRALNIVPGEVKQATTLTASDLNAIVENKVAWTEPLRELSRIIPSGVWLSKLKASYDKSGQRSLVVNGSAGSEVAVSGFYARLESSYHLRNVAMSFAERQKDTVPLLYNFEFKVPLTKGNGKASTQSDSKIALKSKTNAGAGSDARAPSSSESMLDLKAVPQ